MTFSSGNTRIGTKNGDADGDGTILADNAPAALQVAVGTIWRDWVCDRNGDDNEQKAGCVI
jgi:hypothetical protein